MSSKITPNAGLYSATLDPPPIALTGYSLGAKPSLIDGDKTTECGSWNGWNVYQESYGLDLGSAQTVGSFIIYDDNGTSDPLSSGQVVVLYGSDNDNWTQHEILDHLSGLSRSGNATICTLSTPATGRYWRIYIASALSVAVTAIGIAEIEAYDLGITVDTTTLMSTAYVLPYTTADPTQFTFNNGESTDYLIPDYREPKLKHICDHVLSSGIFKLANCPRCLGNGYYYDVKLDPMGLISQVEGVDKLTQELEKIVLTPLGSSTFHNLYGTLIGDSHMKAIGDETKEQQLKRSIINAILRLKMLQEQSIDRGAGFTASELILRISRIEVFEIYGAPTSIGYRVYIVTPNGENSLVEGTIIF